MRQLGIIQSESYGKQSSNDTEKQKRINAVSLHRSNSVTTQLLAFNLKRSKQPNFLIMTNSHSMHAEMGHKS